MVEEEREVLLEKIRLLEEKLKACQERERELETLLSEYNDILKRQFQLFDEFFEKLGTKSMIDPTTRVYSRDHFMKLLSYQHQKSFEENIPYSIFMVKLSNLKELENKEMVLMKVGKSLKECVRVPLDSVARYSEDTFIMFTVDVNKEVSGKIMERISNSLENIPSLRVKLSFKNYPEDFVDLELALSELERMVE